MTRNSPPVDIFAGARDVTPQPRLWVSIFTNADAPTLQKSVNAFFYRASRQPECQLSAITVSQDAKTIVVTYLSPVEL
jgi:hypothetical protein